ncbi:photosynthetic reaction center subunit H [Citromicrobium bathyomarinum]|uniref:photosynthetic reaction center subunit H n=1 Tax=Citromicrobium bathyomarinum TaxID=72174 RepID=UPI00315A3D5F
MIDPYLVGTLDITELVFLAFVLFFIALIFYLRREDRREGYPLENEMSGFVESPGGPLSRASVKTFKLPHGRGTVTPEDSRRERVDIPAKPSFGAHGAPFVPTGDPLIDGLGPASWAERKPVPDITHDGRPRIVPLSLEADISIATRDANPIGMMVIGADKQPVGEVTEVWIDRAEHVIRYLQIATEAGKTVLAPMAMSVVRKGKGVIVIDALNAAQFAGAPVPAAPDQITFYEEERIVAYFGGGYLYATPERQEPLL